MEIRVFQGRFGVQNHGAGQVKLFCRSVLMVIMIPGVTINGLEFTPGFQKYMIHRVGNASMEPSLYLEDVPELPDHPYVDHDD